MSDAPMEHQTESTSGGTPKNGMVPLLIVGLIVIVGLAGFLILHKKSKSSTAASDTTMTQELSASSSPTETASASATPVADSQTDNDVKVIAVEAGSFYFKPNEIHVKKGDKVKIVMTSKDMMHDFNIDELGVKLPITRAGQTNTVEFVANKAGTFEYYCSVGQHRAHGQVGKIFVE